MAWIGISGAHGVGKSSVISDIENILQERITVVREVAREVIAKGFPLGKEADTDSYVCLVAEYIKARSTVRNKTRPIVVFDRTILDTLSYAMVNLTRGVAVKHHVIELLEAVWKEEKNSFSEYIFIPIEFEETKRSGTELDESYRAQISDKIMANLYLSDVNFSELRGGREERVSQLASILSKYL